MKTLIAALLLSSISAPAVMAMDGSLDMIISDTAVGTFPILDEMGRRSGQCPKRGLRVAREGSTCGGV